LGYRKAGGGEGKGLSSREVGFEVGKGHGSTGEPSGALIAVRMTWETMRWPSGNVDDRLISTAEHG